MIVVVTVTHNPKKDGILDAFLRCIRAQSRMDSALLIIDNASFDGTQEQLREIADPRIFVVLNEENRGFAAACNQGIDLGRELGADKILFLNNDTEFGDTMIADLAVSLDRTGAAAISPMVTYFDRPDRIWYAGGYFSKWRGYVNVHEKHGQSANMAGSEPRLTEFASGCCLMLTREALETIGGWDERFFVYWEDVDLSFRLGAAGAPIVVDPSIRVRHKASSSTGGKLSDFTLRHASRNHMLLLRKHFGVLALIYTLGMIGTKTAANLVLRRLSFRQARLKFRGLREGLRLAKNLRDSDRA